jgi:hypothetical protein
LAYHQRRFRFLVLDTHRHVCCVVRPGIRIAASLTGVWVALVFALSACTSVAPDPSPSAEPAEVGVSDSLREVKRCMEKEGFEAEFNHQGGLVGPEMPPEQSQLWLDASWKCMEAAGMTAQNYTTAQLEDLYALEVESYQCLLDAGYPADPPPSEQAFIDSWNDRSKPPYQAISAVAEVAPGAWNGAIAACPPPRWSF